MAPLAVAAATLLCVTAHGRDPAAGPGYAPDGTLRFPADYRQWIYLSTGFDMSYAPGASPAHHMFDNVFVNPEAYREFQRTGTWPDGAMLVLEVRGARDKGSINQAGHFQDETPMGIEVHVRDAARFPGKWAFFSFDGGGSTGKLQPQSADCYSCHAAHAAVDTTFVQFYPTLLPLARAKGTLSSAYTAEQTGAH